MCISLYDKYLNLVILYCGFSDVVMLVFFNIVYRKLDIVKLILKVDLF